MVHKPKPPTAKRRVFAGFFHGGEVGEEEGHDHGSDGVGGAEPAEALWADVEDFVGEGGEEVDDAAEQDG